MTDSDRIGDILSLVRETRADVVTIKKSLYGNGSGIGFAESLRVVTAIVDEHINEHDERIADSKALKRAGVNRALNIMERAVPWGLLVGFLFSR